MSIEELDFRNYKRNQSINQIIRIGLYVNLRIGLKKLQKKSITQFLRIGLYIEGLDFRN